MPSSAPTGDRPRTQRRGFRLTTRVFWDLAIYMVGLAVGVIFPLFATLLGVPAFYAGRSWFRIACLGAGFAVGAMNYALCRFVGGRMETLAGT